jgi:pyroglutamyl-peptidase
VNPSWLAVEPLHNTVITIDPPSKPAADGSQPVPVDESSHIRAIHISALQIPVSYEAVLDIVPGLHARPPVLPRTVPPFSPLPDRAYDFIFHIGVAGRGPLRMEKLGHKLGYHMKDADAKLAPVVRSSPKDFSRRPDDPSPAENLERERLGMDMVENGGGDVVVRPTRGFGSAYETFPDDLPTDIDVTRLVQDLKCSGIEVSLPRFATYLSGSDSHGIANIHVDGCRSLSL